MVSDRHQLRVLKRAKKGDAEAFAGLCYRYADAVYRYLYFRLGSVLAAEEVAVQVFVRAWEVLPSDPRQGVMPFVSWLFLIANDVVMERNERFLQEGLHPPRPPLVSWSGPDGDAKGPQLHPRHLAQAIMQLDDISQQVVLLRFVLRVSHRDTGLVVGDTSAGSRVLQYRGLLTVREKLTRKKMSEQAYASDYVGAATFCIDRIISGQWRPEDCLEHMPQENDRLERILQFAVMVREASRIRPRESFEDDLKKQLLVDLRNSARRPVRQPLIWRWFLSISERVPAPVVAAFLLGLILFVGIAGTSGIVLAIDSAMPGDRLYDLDLRLEQAYRAFLTDPTSRLQYSLEVTEERLAEAEMLASRGDASGLQMAIVAYSVEISTMVAEDLSGQDQSLPVDIDRRFSQQQQRLDRLFVTAMDLSATSQGRTAPVVACDKPDGGHDSVDFHPVGLTLASQHGVDYAEVVDWVCEGHSFGEIVLALATAGDQQAPAGDIIVLKSELGGWGQLWHELQDKGGPQPANAGGGSPSITAEPRSTGIPGPPTPRITPTEDASATPEVTRAAGNDNQGSGRGNGPPDDVGPPDDRGRPEDPGSPNPPGGGPPDHAGPPGGDGPPGNGGNPGNGGGRPDK